MNLNATIFGQAISFVLFVWFCMKYVWPPIILAIETRQKDIEESLMRLKKHQQELCLLQKKIDQKIVEEKKRVSIILNEANKEKILILEEARKKSLEESQNILAKTQLEIQFQIKDARKNLHKEIVDLSILMAEKIIKKNISKDDKSDLLNQSIASLQVKN